jgi:glutamine amidotransferase
LAFIDAEVKKLNNFNKTLVVPHMGWNDISTTSFKVFNGLARGSCFYFVHSYAMRLNETKDLEIAYTDYGEPIVAYVSKGNIHGAQFHPEKSQGVGLQFLRNFIELC